MELHLKGKRALVTGSSSGIGAETALRWGLVDALTSDEGRPDKVG